MPPAGVRFRPDGRELFLSTLSNPIPVASILGPARVRFTPIGPVAPDSPSLPTSDDLQASRGSHGVRARVRACV